MDQSKLATLETNSKCEVNEENEENNGELAPDGGSQPNPNGFFADYTSGSGACSVAVAVRVRPLVGRELTEGTRKECIFPAEGGATTDRLQIGGKSFTFDTVFWADEKQENIFDKCTRNLVLGCFHGYNATILAYGQTGSGKTHTMGTGYTLGVAFEEVGIVPRVFKFIFDELELRRAQSEYSEFKVKISFLELYNEELHDLLDPASQVRDKITGKPMRELQIREEKGGLISVRGLKENEVTSQEECLHLLNSGINHRITGQTQMNAESSRSHAIFTVTIEQKIVKEVEDAEGDKKDSDEKATVTEEISAKFHFVDLAGSERIKKTGATGQLLKEGISINKGLLCLGQVIKSLTNEKSSKEHIPYRDSKLTRILQDSLGGNSRTTMIACVSPSDSNFEETLGTIKYASQARNIKNKPVVNRDPNSMLIESLRTQITHLQLEVTEYVSLLKTSGVEIPSSISDKMFEKQKQQETIQRKNTLTQAPTGANPNEVKELKIKLSHKEREIRELSQKMKDQQLFLDQKDKQLKDMEKERDHLALKSEAMAVKLKSANIEFEFKAPESKPGAASESNQKQSQRANIDKLQKELQQKIREVEQLKKTQERNDKILKKHMDENRDLKKQIQNGGQSSMARQAESAGPPVQRKDFKTMRAQRKEQAQKQIEEFNTKFLDDLQGQIDDMLANSVKRRANKENAQGDDGSRPEDKPTEEDEKEGEGAESTPKEKKEEIDPDIIEREKLLAGVRQAALSMSSDIKDLLKNEWAGSINNLQSEKKKAEAARGESLLAAKNDQKAILAIEKEHKQKMDTLNNQLNKLEKEKSKKEESVARQIAMQEARIKSLEADVEKQRKMKDEVERAKKYDENRFFKFKMEINKDLAAEKKKTTEKEKQMTKLKTDLKKVEDLAQQKIQQLKGLQRRAQEEKQQRDELQEREMSSKGIDIDLIKQWITTNTEAMLKHAELKEYYEKQQLEKDKVENEMLEEGDRMTELLIEKEKLEFEKEELECQEEKDEGRILELDDQLKDIALEINSITETLDMLEETLEFVMNKIQQVQEEIEGFDMESIQQLSFGALDSVESARVTLKTFFQIFLEANIYRRDLENKCIEQDENVLKLGAQIKQLEARLQYKAQTGGMDGYSAHMQKQNAISNVIKQVEGYVDHRDVEHLNLNPSEQTNLTKLSLSKIVNNLKNKLKDQEVKCQQISLKLDQALKQKEVYKSRCDEMKNQLKNQQFMSQPRSKAYQGVTSKLNAHEQQNQQSPFQKGGESSQPKLPASKPLSFKDRQRQKKEEQIAQGKQPTPQAKQVESLADRRKNKKNLIGDSVNEISNELDRLKQTAEDLTGREQGRFGNLLEDIEEEDLPDIELEMMEEEENQNRRKKHEMDDAKNEQKGNTSSLLEPDQNLSMLMLSDKRGNEQETDLADEEWIPEKFITIPSDSKLVDFSFSGTHMICIFENYVVQEVEMATKKVHKTYNLQEIEGFEIDEEVEHDKIKAFSFEKDVQLLSVACMTKVHIFEYSEEGDISLSHIACVDHANIVQLLFVDYILVMVEQEAGSTASKVICFDPEVQEIRGSIVIERNGSESLIIQPGNECCFFAAGTVIGKILLPDTSLGFAVNSKHTDKIIDMAISAIGSVITASADGDIRFFNAFNGLGVAAPLEEMECDHLATHGIHLLTRIGHGEAMLVWKLQINGVGENPIGEVELDEEDRNDASNQLMFQMKGGVQFMDQEGQTSETLVMMHLNPTQVKFNLLKQKLNKA